MSIAYDYRFLLGPHSEISLPLQRLLTQNSKRLHEVGSEFPPVKLHRETMNKMLKRTVLELASPSAHNEYLTSILEKTETECIIYTYDAFIGSRKNALVDGVLYPSLEKKIYPLRQLTQGHNVTLVLPLQHVVQFIDKELKNVPGLRKKLSSNPGDFSFSWLTFVWRIREAWPEARIVLWDVDEVAYNWPGFVALLTGYSNTLKFSGIENYTASCLAEKGRDSFPFFSKIQTTGKYSGMDRHDVKGFLKVRKARPHR